nr:hypothetical protein [uncultured Rhodopila sp.]
MRYRWLPLAVLLLANSARAQTAAIAGAGVLPCSDYVKAARSSDPAAAGFVAWAQGLMTGFNLARLDGGKSTHPLGQGGEQQAAFLLAWCLKHPDRQFVMAAMGLYRDLPRR